jgi:cytoskeletal protein CcmA (bactofilin family)
MLYRPYQSILTLFVVLFFYNGTTQPDVQVTGTWEARFSGKVQGKGTSQDDTLLRELTQAGSTVRGTLRFTGLETSFPITGTVKGKTFSYSAKASIGPNCEATVVAETTVDDVAGRFEGSQTQSNCEGTAVGCVAAVRH